ASPTTRREIGGGRERRRARRFVSNAAPPPDPNEERCASDEPIRARGGASPFAMWAGQASDASIVMSIPARAWEIGQPDFAPSAIFWNSSSEISGTLAETLRWLPVTPVPGTNV